MNKPTFQQVLKERGLAVSPGNTIQHRREEGEFELSASQKSMWFLQQLDTSSPVYNNPSAVKIDGRLEIEMLKIAIEEILVRHEIINTNFLKKEGLPVQIIRKKKLPFRLHQSGGFSSSVEKELIIQKTVNQIAKEPFDLQKDCLLRADVLKINECEHILILNIHHIVSDGWSKEIILREVSQLYQAFSTNMSSTLSILPIQYYDYIRWQKDLLTSAAIRSQMQFWKEKLTNAPLRLQLPADFQGPAIQTNNGSLIPFVIEQHLSDQVIAFCKREKVSVYTFLLAVFKIFLAKYSQQNDICVGTPIAGRRNTAFEKLVGLFVNTIVVRTQVNPEVTFHEYLQHVKKELFLAYNNQDTPFEMLVEAINPVREMSFTPLYQVMFQFDTAVTEQLTMGNLQITPLPVDTGVSQVDLSVSCWEASGWIRGTFEFNTDLYKPETIRRMIGHYINLIANVLDLPNEKISLLSVLNSADKTRILKEWNDTEFNIPADSNLKAMFEEVVMLYPDQVAIETENQKITYNQLNIRCNQLVNKLLLINFKKGNNILICTSDLAEATTGVLASIKIGGVFTLIDPEYPDERIFHIIDEFNDPFLLTNKDLAGRLKDKTKGTLSFEEECVPDNYSTPDIWVEAEVPLCVIYTSGSTGKPKGVVLSHLNLINLVSSFKLSYNPTLSDKLLPVTSVGSASFVGEVLPVLTSGGSLVFANVDTILDTNRFYNFLKAKEITILSTVPSFISRLNALNLTYPKLRLLLSGGEQLLPSHISNFDQSVKLINGYGLTESGICNTYVELGSHTDERRFISLGRPVINNQAYILDDYMHPVPEGVVGNIYISGKSIALGYWNSQSLTNERFIAHPFLQGSKILKTGDIGYWLSNGELCFCGRSDKQVQIRGYRVEPGEIEAEISKYPTIEDVVVVAQDSQEGCRLVAYYVTINLQILKSHIVREWLREKLPSYMIPEHLVQLDQIPYNVNGKVDRNALPAVSATQKTLDYSDAPETKTEKNVAAIWAEVLHLEYVGLEENFFDLGGHSLLLASVLDKLKAITVKDVSIMDLFRYTTIRSLANFIESDKVEHTSPKNIIQKAQRRSQSFGKFSGKLV